MMWVIHDDTVVPTEHMLQQTYGDKSQGDPHPPLCEATAGMLAKTDVVANYHCG
jgi:hypothetical protein